MKDALFVGERVTDALIGPARRSVVTLGDDRKLGATGHSTLILCCLQKASSNAATAPPFSDAKQPNRTAVTDSDHADNGSFSVLIYMHDQDRIGQFTVQAVFNPSRIHAPPTTARHVGVDTVARELCGLPRQRPQLPAAAWAAIGQHRRHRARGRHIYQGKRVRPLRVDKAPSNF